jgi:aspartate/methionine/tyrosine aminotransferase
MFKRSHRIPDDLTPNPIADARSRLGDIPFDLTVSNPTLCAFSYPREIAQTLHPPVPLAYRPDPRGPGPTRQAVATEYRRWAIEVEPDHVVLTASTSEAYSMLFRLLCDPGEAVLVPSPSYPLFEHLARLDGVETLTYDLDPDSNWRVDFSSLNDAPDAVRAVVVVHPNNPTGSFVHPADAERLVSMCHDRGWALIADEVFSHYPLDGGPGQDRSFADVNECLCFVLGGLSKCIGMPQLKLAWIVVSGPDTESREALEGLDFVTDTYLSVSTPIAAAAPRLLEFGESIRAEISGRCRSNLESLRRLAENQSSVTVLGQGGGWSAVLRVPVVGDENDLFVRLLNERGVAVFPGYFFDFPHRGFAVASLLPDGNVFCEGIRRMLDMIGQSISSDIGGLR